MNHTDPKTLTVHPAAHAVPDLPPRQYAALKESIERLGIRQPLLADAEGRVIDGRHRLKIANEIGLEAVPVDTVTGDDAVMVACESAVARRNLTASGVVLVLYMAHPALKGGGVRPSSKANLKQGASRNCLQSISGESKEYATFRSLADRYQVPVEYFSMLADIEAACEGDEGEWKNVQKEILEDEKCVSWVKAGLGGKKATKGTKKPPTDYRDLVIHSTVSVLSAFKNWPRIRWEKSDNAKKDVRALTISRFREAVQIAPPEIREELPAAILKWPAHELKHLAAAIKKQVGS